MKPAKFKPRQNERNLALMSNCIPRHINNISRKHYVKHVLMPKV